MPTSTDSIADQIRSIVLAVGSHSGRGCPFTASPDSGLRKTTSFEIMVTGGAMVAVAQVEPTTASDTGPALFGEPETLARIDCRVYQQIAIRIVDTVNGTTWP